MREQIIERGEDPESYPILASKPEIFTDLVWIWEAFSTISGSRQLGFNGPQPLALNEVLSYAHYRGINDPEDREELLHLVQHLDRVFMNDFAAKSKANKPGKP
jgi:hypothetical protein